MKIGRHAKILELIQKNEIGTQEDYLQSWSRKDIM